MFIELNNDLPGYSTIWTLNIIGREAKMVKNGGWIVEIGSYCGRSSYVIGKNKHPSVCLTCIDAWPSHPTPIHDNGYAYGNIAACFNYSSFLDNMATIENFNSLRCTLPIDLPYLDFSKKIDLLFFDLEHHHDFYPSQLSYWHRFMNNDSKIMLNDYRSNKDMIDSFCLMIGAEVTDDMNVAIIGL